MTFHSKAAHNDIYDMFNQQGSKTQRDDTQSGDETDFGDEYSEAESTGTGRISAATSEFGDETLARVAGGQAIVDDFTQGSQPTSVSPWSDFTASKHVPKVDSKKAQQHKHLSSEDLTDNFDSTQEQTQTSGVGGSFDTQAIAAIANGDFENMKTLDIARLAGDVTETGEIQSQPADRTDDSRSDAEALTTPIDPESPHQIEVSHATRYVPTAPEDYEPTPMRPFRDPAELAQNRLPFMTPIEEATESSFGGTVRGRNGFHIRNNEQEEEVESPSKIKLDPLSINSPEKGRSVQSSPSKDPSPKRRIREALEEEDILTGVSRKLKNSHTPTFDEALSSQEDLVPAKPKAAAPDFKIADTPVIIEDQSLPLTAITRQEILGKLTTPVSSYPGYSESDEAFHHRTDLEKLVVPPGQSPKKGTNIVKKNAANFLLRFPKTSRVYAVKRSLGQGAFGAAFLAESTVASGSSAVTPVPTPSSSPTHKSNVALSRSVTPVEDKSGRADYEAIKMEAPPATIPWEFHMIRLAHARLAKSTDPIHQRVAESLVRAHECHVFQDEAYLVLSYSSQGTILDLINSFCTARTQSGQSTDNIGLDESLAMFFGIELIRTMQAFHAIGILHGDIKSDNCLVRFDPALPAADLWPYNRDGADGWADRGVTFIDLGRAIDLKCFVPAVKFQADWDHSASECPEIRMGRPYKYNIDYYGVADLLHECLFTKHLVYKSDPPIGGDSLATAPRTHSLPGELHWKRGMAKDLWLDVFGVLLNSGTEVDEVRVRELERVLGRMQAWLEEKANAKDLKARLAAAERYVAARK
jgi:checkpoint serine/threonine-protein kinase